MMRLKGQSTDLYIWEFVPQIDWNSMGQFIPEIFTRNLMHRGAKNVLILLFKPLLSSWKHQTRTVGFNERRATFNGCVCVTKYSWCCQTAWELIKACGLSPLWRPHGSLLSVKAVIDTRRPLQEEPSVSAEPAMVSHAFCVHKKIPAMGKSGMFWRILFVQAHSNSTFSFCSLRAEQNLKFSQRRSLQPY